MPRRIKITIVLMLFLAVSAVAGGYAILGDPSGAFLKMSTRDLDGSPFPDFFIPGLFLLVVLGFGAAVAALLLWRRPGRVSRGFAAGISATLLIWLTAVVGYRGFLQPLYGSVGVIMLVLLEREHS